MNRVRSQPAAWTCLLVWLLCLEAAGAASARALDVWMSGDTLRFPGFELIAEKFEAAHPDVEVKLMNVPGSWTEQYERLVTAYAAGVEPDVMYGKGYWLYEFAPKGMLLDLTSYWNRDKHLLNASPVFYDHIRIGATYRNRVYGFPRGEYWYVLGYNTRMFAEAGIAAPPNTWEELREVGRKLTNPTKKTFGFAMDSYTRKDAVFVETFLDTITRQAGGSIMTIAQDGWPIYTVDTPQSREGFTFLLDNIHQLAITVPPEFQGAVDQLRFNNQVGMWWIHGGHASRYIHDSPDFEFSSAVMPNKVNRWTYIADNKFFVSARTKLPNDAWELLRFFTSQEAEAVLAPFEGHVSVWQANWTMPTFRHPSYKGLIQQLLLPETQPFQMHAGWERVRGAIAAELQKAVRREVSVPAALGNAQRMAEQILREIKAGQ